MATSAISEERHHALDKKANQVMAIFLPLIEAGSIGYGTYVAVYLVCIQYLINPSPDLQMEPRRATGMALIVVYCVLLLVFMITFLRLLQVIWANPAVVPLGDPSSEKQSTSTKHFDRLDAYICDYQGWPLWCDKCHNWKPDRAHHSSQLGRCVRRMDHYCPYAGGIISETSHKFFVQFLFYGFIYTGYVMIIMAVFLAEHAKHHHSTPTTWVVAVALAALFFLFTFGMFMTTFYNLAINYTTVEILQKGGVYNVALLGRSPTPSADSSTQSNVLCEVRRTHSRAYIVVQTEQGDNPWDMGAWKNIQSVMGNSFIEWLVPIRMSPCTMRTNHEGEYGWGSVVRNLMEQYGAGSYHGGPRRSKRRRSSRSQPSQT